MKFLPFIVFFFLSQFHAQDINAFNAIYNKTYLETSHRNFGKALRVADSLFSISGTPALQGKSLMLSAILYSQSGEFEKSLEYALHAKNIVEKTENATAKAKIFGFLATHSRYVWLLDDSKKFTELGIVACRDISDPDISNNIMGMMMQEQAYYNIEYKRYKKAIEKVKLAQRYFFKSKTNSPFQLATNEQLLGDCSYYLGNYGIANSHYEKTLIILKGLPENYHQGLAHKGLTMTCLKEEKYEKAKAHLDSAKQIAEKSNYLSLKKEVNTASEAYYRATQNLREYIKAKESQDTIRKKLNDNAQSFVTKSYKQAIRQNMDIKKNSLAKNIAIGLLLAFIAAGIALFLVYRNKHIKNVAYFKQVLREMDEKHMAIIENNYVAIISKDGNKNKESAPVTEGLNIPDETVQKVLEKLKNFEKSIKYIRNNISSSYLATFCETNTKYLSHILKTYKGKDYHTYINDLRIDYIIQKLTKEPKYRKYKIAVLAEEAGFSSHTKFSAIFKKYTSFTPSVFIKYLDEEEEIKGMQTFFDEIIS